MNDPKDNDFASTDVLDDGDIASAYQMRENAIALQKAQAAMAPETHPDFDGESCVDCGDEIPKLRLNMGKVRCVHCQGKLERKSKLYAPRADE
jgi:RNA polymerase-binding transcription factor DksA